MHTVQCCNCATTFGMSEEIHDLRRKDGQSFWCPLGHKQYWTKPPTAEEETIARLERDVVWLEERNADLREALAEERKEPCPECGKLYLSVSIHISKMHPVLWSAMIEDRITKELGNTPVQ